MVIHQRGHWNSAAGGRNAVRPFDRSGDSQEVRQSKAETSQRWLLYRKAQLRTSKVQIDMGLRVYEWEKLRSFVS